jgi:murein DD-endopeptidase MepM/ murein hydrolase activator NlpD
MRFVRKASAIAPAIAAVALLVLGTTRADARSAGARAFRHSPAKKTIIHQNDAGEVVIDRVEVATIEIQGPIFPIEPHNYPQPLCEPVDTVVEVQFHDAEAGNPDNPEVEAEAVSREVTQSSSGSAYSLSRIAHKLGSFFRPKSSEVAVRPEDVDLDLLLSQGLLIPVEGVNVEKLRDSFLNSRGQYAKHLAIDIGAPRGTPVLATTDGQIIKVNRERRGGKSLYQKDATGKYLLFYCHLNGYAAGMEPGHKVRKGDVIGYVGATGHVIGGPHLHFSVTRLPEESENFKAGMAINPYLLFLAGVP